MEHVQYHTCNGKLGKKCTDFLFRWMQDDKIFEVICQELKRCISACILHACSCFCVYTTCMFAQKKTTLLIVIEIEISQVVEILHHAKTWACSSGFNVMLALSLRHVSAGRKKLGHQPPFHYIDSLSRRRDSHYKYKTIPRLSYLHDKNRRTHIVHPEYSTSVINRWVNQTHRGRVIHI